MDRIYLLVICLALIIVTCSAADDPDFPIIKKLTENGFVSQIEISGRPENYTVSVEEYFDVANKVTKVKILRQGHRQTIIIHSKYNQVASIENNQCKVTGAGGAESLVNPLFANWLYSPEDSNEVYYGPTSILRRAAESPPMYSGLGKVRGMDCHVFTGTDPDRMEVNVKYFFTADWTTPMNISKKILLPVQIQIFGTGIAISDAPDEDFIQYVDYVYFAPAVKDPRVFELPYGIGCKGLKSDEIPLPPITKRFTVAGEQFNDKDPSVVLSVNTFRVWYDFYAKLARIDVYTKDDSGVSKVLDYNTGLMYITRDNKECTAVPISDSQFDAITGDLKLVMKDPETAMGMKGDFYYLGKKFSRGIYCDVWESVVENYTIDELTLNRIVYTYYFSSHWWEIDIDGEVEEQVPIRLEINTYLSPTEESITTSVLNFFHFSKHPPMVYSQFSIEGCESGAPEKKYIGIIMETDIDDATKAEAHAAEVRVLIQNKIISVAGISPIRLPFIRVDFQPNAITTMALILGRAPAIVQFIKLSDDVPKSKEINSGTMKSAELCAEECIKEEICTGFHYCSGKGECFISLIDWTSDWGDEIKSFNPCDVYQRHEAGSQIKDLLLKDALDNLDKVINGGEFFIEIQDKEDAVKFTATDFTPDISPVTSGDHDKDMFSRVVGQKKFIDNKESQTTRSGGQVLSAGECYRKCKKEENIACSSFSFCSDTNECLFSSVLVLPKKDISDELESSPLCAVYSIEYLQMFEEYKGQVRMLPGKEAISADSANECAKTCREMNVTNCRGFDFCYSKKQCVLHNKHVLDVKENDLTSVGSGCSHYALKFSADFIELGRFVLLDPNSKSVGALSVEKCAKICSENIEFKCPSFDFCANDDPDKTKCTLNTLTLNDNVDSEDSDECQHYSQRNVVDDYTIPTPKKRVKSPDPSEVGGYTPGGLAGVIIGVLILGIAVGIIGFLIYSYVRKSRLMDERSVRFVKQENA